MVSILPAMVTTDMIFVAFTQVSSSRSVTYIFRCDVFYKVLIIGLLFQTPTGIMAGGSMARAMQYVGCTQVAGLARSRKRTRSPIEKGVYQTPSKRYSE